jgi:hypothetical protein
LSSEFDSALKEAIRRSLCDIGPKEKEIMDIKPDAPVDLRHNVNEAPIDEKKEELAEGSVAVEEGDEEASSAGAQGIPRSVDVVNDDVQADSEEVKEDTEEDAQDICSEDTTAMEKLMNDADSVDSEKLVDEVEKSIIPSKPSPSDRKHSGSPRDESFASDAKGSGELAEAIGATLDSFAGVISEMLSESDVLDHEADNNEDSSELIVDSTEMVSKGGSKEDEEWSVVKSVGSNGTTESEQIAKAAEMLGSALFNSDMKNSTENMSAISGSCSDSNSAFSVPSSVPSDICTQQSQVAPAQRNRWAAHLAQLRELGFENEPDCILVIERLIAANIGVGAEDDDISINHVVNELLNQQKK